MDSEQEQPPGESSVASGSEASEAPSNGDASDAGGSQQLSNAQVIACATVGATTGNASASELAALRGLKPDLVAALEQPVGCQVAR